jgi:dTDP-4-amino-4,6-dideoxygalactose transaminase
MKALIRLSRSIVGNSEIEAVSKVLENGYLGMGAECQAFEQELSAYLGGDRQVVCVNTGTAALHLALQAFKVTAGDEVLVPSLTYVASFQAISACGATPVACDVRAETGLLDLDDATRRVTPRTKVLMLVHYASYPGDLNAAYTFAKRHRLRVVEDAAHAFGCEYAGKKIGDFGDVVCFSFDGIKNITSGEGGAVVTADQEVIARVQDARLLGVVKDSEKRYSGERSWEFDVTEQGWRYHMSDLMAAIGRTQLNRFESEFKPKRMALARRYRELLEGLGGVRMFKTDLETVVPHILPIRILGGQREKVTRALSSKGIQSGLHYKPNHLLTKFGAGGIALPVVERLYKELLTLPLHPGVSIDEVDRIVDVVRNALNSEST